MQNFINDYSEGACEQIIDALSKTNMVKQIGYGNDEYSISARNKIRKAVGVDDADVFFISGGTQTNTIVISSILKNFEGVISPYNGHIATHEAGAIECSGHKVITIKDDFAKIDISELENYLVNFHKDMNNEHMVNPAMVYISQPTEYGMLYSLDELKKIRKICDEYNLKLFIDGARLGYALSGRNNDVGLKDLAKLADVFYIGGTKCGALVGEAVVVPKKGLIPNFVTMIKQRGGLLAKGRLLGLQFDVLFTDNLYEKICKNGVDCAFMIRDELIKKGYKLYCDSPTNQQFIVVSNEKLQELKENIGFGYMDAYDENSSIIRLCTSFATKKEDVEKLKQLL